LKRLEKSINSHQDKLRELEDEVSHLPAERELQTGLKELEGKFATLRSQLDKEAGALEKIEESIRKSILDLTDKKYHGIEERYKLKHIHLHSMKAANKDLDKYYQALDKALMRFHEMKMEEINKIVKEYWQETYQGQDIDTIEIKADVESSTPNRRSHNYRLVMRHKSQAELDMRGRCRYICRNLRVF
jgi:DNA repair protein RAD50